MPKKRPPADTCTCGHPKDDHWRGEGQCEHLVEGKYQCGCTWWHPQDPQAWLDEQSRRQEEGSEEGD